MFFIPPFTLAVTALHIGVEKYLGIFSNEIVVPAIGFLKCAAITWVDSVMLYDASMKGG